MEDFTTKELINLLSLETQRFEKLDIFIKRYEDDKEFKVIFLDDFEESKEIIKKINDELIERGAKKSEN